MAELGTYVDLVGRVQEDLFLVLEKWKTHFGSGLHKTWKSTKSATQNHPCFAFDTIVDLVETAKGRLNERGRIGEASLLVRDPREDTLLLVYSTSPSLQKGTATTKQVREPEKYYDSKRHCYFYPLLDRLADTNERESDRARKSRGLTGWVAVAGHYLIVNGEYGQHGLSTLPEDRPETLGACQTYGNPMWAHHISEAPSIPERPKRYIAVPVKSNTDKARTIGVLRYACPCNGRELGDADLVLMKELSDLISATLGLEAATTRAIRGSSIGHEKEHLRRTYDFGTFLAFLANAMNSSIASVYMEMDGIIGHGSRLRLVDAFGIRSRVADLRRELLDYGPNDSGFTRWLFDQGRSNPTVVPSVHVHESWAGKNTLAFYGDHFSKLVGPARSGATDVARQYEIKIIGLPLICDGERIGVLKVELPNSFDDHKHYADEDQAFLVDCAGTLGEVLGEFRAFLRGMWFEGDAVQTIVSVTTMSAELLRTHLIMPTEANDFWKDLAEFIKGNEVHVTEQMKELLDGLAPDEKVEIAKSESWVGSFGRDLMAEVVVKLLLENLR